MASRDMPRLIAWVARVCRSWWGWGVWHPRGRGHGVQDPGDRVPVGGVPVLPGQQQRVLWRGVLSAVGVDQLHQLRVQQQVAVLAQLADRHVQPRGGADEHDGVGAQCGELTHAQPGAQQDLDGDPHEEPVVVVRGAQQLRGGGVVQGLGQGVVLAGQVTGEHRHLGRGSLPAPFLDSGEEHP
jgi:hypothetical protein